MADIKRGFLYQWESGKKEMGLILAVIFLLGAIFFPGLNFFIASKKLVAPEKWFPGVIAIYKALIHLRLIDLVQTAYYKEFPSMIKQGITRESFFKANMINFLIRILIVALSFAILGKGLRYNLSIFHRPDLLKSTFIYGYNFDLIRDSFLLLFSKILFTLLLVSFSTNILGSLYYKKNLSERAFLVSVLLLNGLLGFGLGASRALETIFNSSPVLILLIAGILFFFLGSYIAKHIIKRTDVLG